MSGNVRHKILSLRFDIPPARKDATFPTLQTAIVLPATSWKSKSQRFRKGKSLTMKSTEWGSWWRMHQNHSRLHYDMVDECWWVGCQMLCSCIWDIMTGYFYCYNTHILYCLGNLLKHQWQCQVSNAEQQRVIRQRNGHFWTPKSCNMPATFSQIPRKMPTKREFEQALKPNKCTQMHEECSHVSVWLMVHMVAERNLLDCNKVGGLLYEMNY